MTPFFTVVVAARDTRAYIGACLGSLFDQDFRDFELIVVDDASTDGTAEILAGYSDPRLRVIRLELPSGPGPARNAGIAEARGRYLLFLDSDDVMTAGSLTAIRNRLEETGRPEVLLFDYARWYWDGRRERNILGERITTAAQRGVFSLAERPDLLGIFNAPWSKAYRLDFVSQWGLTFPAGYYEDLPWTMGALMMATRLAALDRIVVLYRQRLDGSILRSRDRRHLDVFEQWDRTFALLDANPQWELFRDELFDFMINQFDAMLVAHGRIPHDARHEFFTSSTRTIRRHRPPGWSLPMRGTDALRGTRIRLRALADGNETLFETIASNKPRVDRIKDLARGSLPAARRRIGAHLPDRPERGYRWAGHPDPDHPLAVFSSYWHRTPACNPLAISAELARRSPSVHQVWITREEHAHAVPSYASWAAPSSREYGTALAHASLLVNNVNYPDWLRRQPDQLYVQTQHGTPLKTMGIDMLDRPGARTGFDSWPALINRIGQWTHCLSANRFSTLVWERSMPGPYQMWELGYPRNDPLVRMDPDRISRARAALRLGDRTVVLYAPTIRDYGAVPGTLLDVPAFASRLPESHVLLVRSHYLQGRTTGPTERVIDVTDHHPIEELLLASDVLLTDYSSTMFDFANTGRPIINYCPDWDAYRIVRGTYFDLSVENAGAFCRTEDEVLALVTDPGALRSLAAGQTYGAFRDKYCQFDGGNAAERVVDQILSSMGGG